MWFQTKNGGEIQLTRQINTEPALFAATTRVASRATARDRMAHCPAGTLFTRSSAFKRAEFGLSRVLQLSAAGVCCQIPNSNVAILITRNQLGLRIIIIMIIIIVCVETRKSFRSCLIRVQNDGIYSGIAFIFALTIWCPEHGIIKKYNSA
jgi:hypothetical protein